MNRHRLIPSLLLVLLAGCQPDQGHQALGTLERNRISITAPATETITAVSVREGQSLNAGDLILQLDTTSADARVRQRQAELRQSNAALAELEAGARSETIAAAKARLQGANASLTEASQQLKRSESLFAKGMLGQAELDSSRARQQAAAASLQLYQDQLRELQNGTRPEQLAQARAAAEAAEARLQIEQKALADLSIRAPSNTVLDILPWHTGDRVSAGTLLASLQEQQLPWARVYLPEQQLAHLKPGSQVQVQIEGLQQPLTGVIRTIRAQPAFTPYFGLNERDRARLMHLTDIDLGPEAASLPSGLGVAVLLP